MADYWKSIPKKFCEYCKCWITNNKSSINFHEGGKKHKDNVEKKLSELRKKGEDDYRTQQSVNRHMAEMDKAALAALHRDLARDPSMAAQYKSDIIALKEKIAQQEEAQRVEEERLREEARRGKATASALRVAEKAVGSVSYPTLPPPQHAPPAQGDWQEVRPADGGSKYYWNTKTGAVQWEKPASMNVSSHTPTSDAEKVKSKVKQEAGGSMPHPAMKIPARKQMDTPKFEIKLNKSGVDSPYGTWKQVDRGDAAAGIDLELPVKTDATQLPPPPVILKKEKVSLFKEKTSMKLATDLTSDVTTPTFKKLKTSHAHRNIRKTNTIDD